MEPHDSAKAASVTPSHLRRVSDVSSSFTIRHRVPISHSCHIAAHAMHTCIHVDACASDAVGGTDEQCWSHQNSLFLVDLTDPGHLNVGYIVAFFVL